MDFFQNGVSIDSTISDSDLLAAMDSQTGNRGYVSRGALLAAINKALTPKKKQFITGRSQGLGQSTTGLSANTIDRLGSRIVFPVGYRGAKNVRLVYPSFFLAPQYTPAPNAFTVAGGIERNSKFSRAAFSGAASVSVTPSTPLYESDVVVGAVEAGETVCVRTEATCAVGQQVPTGYLRYPSGNTVETIPQSTGQASQLDGIGAMPIAGSYTHAGYGYGPIALVGEPDGVAPSVLVFGDSIADGNGYHTAGNDGHQGYIALGLYNAGVAHCKATRGSNRVDYSTPDVAPGQFALLEYATHLICNLGTNDLFLSAASRPLADIQSDLLEIWAAAKVQGVKVYQQLILPRTSSTDSWATTANQTPLTRFVVGGDRDLLNAWIYDKVADGTIDGVINPLRFCESPTTPGVWPAGATADGVHPTSATHIAMAAVVTSASNGWKY